MIVILLCSCNDEAVTVSSEPEIEEEVFDISTVKLEELPTEMLAEDLSTWDWINLIAQLPEENVSLYGLSVNDDGTGVIFRKDDKIYYYDWAWFTTQAKFPEIAALDIDDDDSDEIAISMYVDYNTNVSIEELHIVDFENGEPVDKCFSSDLIMEALDGKYDIRFETDELPEESTDTKSKEEEEESREWLIDHTSDLGKRVIFEQKADEVAEGKKAKKYFTYDATRIIRENGEYNGITGLDTNVDYTFSKGKVNVKLKAAIAFKDSTETKFICTISGPVTIEEGRFELGSLKFSKI